MTLREKLIGIRKRALPIAVVGSVALGMGVTCNSYFNPDTVQTHVRKLDHKMIKGHDTYLVFTDAGVFRNTDAKYRLKWNSSDLQNELIALQGQRVEIEKYGWRIGFRSQYENVVGVRPLNPQ
jgi:hypothetical protein